MFKYKKEAVLLIISTILFVPSLIHLTSTENAGGFRYRWYERIDDVISRTLYSKSDAYTAPFAFVFGAIYYEIFSWKNLPVAFNISFYLISMTTVYLLYNAFKNEKYSYLWAPVIFFYFQPQDFSLLFAEFFFVLALNLKRNYIHEALLFSLSSLSKQIMVIPGILFLFFYNEKRLSLEKFARKLAVFLIPWLLIFLYLGFFPTINQLFFKITAQGFTIFDWITNYNIDEFITRNSKIFLYPTTALLGVLLISLYKKKDRTTAIIFLSFAFFLLSQSKFGADPYFAVSTPVFAVLFFRNKKLRPFLTAVILLYYMSYLQIYTGQLLMWKVARINLNVFYNILVENMTHVSVIPPPIYYPENIFKTLNNHQLNSNVKIQNILFGDGSEKYELFQIMVNKTQAGECYPINIFLPGFNCDQCKPTVEICYDNSEDYNSAKLTLAKYYIENLPRLCEESRTIFVLKQDSLRRQGILDYQGLCTNEDDIYVKTINIKKQLYIWIPRLSVLIFILHAMILLNAKKSKPLK